jgi:hypothetical protein
MERNRIFAVENRFPRFILRELFTICRLFEGFSAGALSKSGAS